MAALLIIDLVFRHLIEAFVTHDLDELFLGVFV